MRVRRALLVGWIAAGIGLASGHLRADENPPPAETAPADSDAKDGDLNAGTPAWSPTVLGLRGRLELDQVQVFNGTLIVATSLHLENVADLGNPMHIPWTRVQLKFRVVDAAGRELPQHGGPIEDLRALPVDLVLPHSGAMSFDISHNGSGVPADQLAIIDLGDDCWVLTEKDGPCRLSGTLEIAQAKDEKRTHVWHGRLELPAIAIPTRIEPLDPATAQQTIDKLGRTMIDMKNPDWPKARVKLSFIDDPRVIPWYLKVFELHSYEMKSTALDRLSHFNSDEALAGLQKGLLAKAEDFDDCTTHELAVHSADGMRHHAACDLARSPHPRAKAILLSLRSDRSMPIRLTVLHELGRMTDEASLEMIREMTKDKDEIISREAQRYLGLRTKAAKANEDADGGS